MIKVVQSSFCRAVERPNARKLGGSERKGEEASGGAMSNKRSNRKELST